MSYYVYLIESVTDGGYYIGQTNDINRRLKRHNQDKVATTRKKVLWKLVKYETYSTRSEVMWREHLLKTRHQERDNFINRR